MPATQRFSALFILIPLLIALSPARVQAQMDMLPQIFRDLPPELQDGLPESMEYDEYRRLNRNVDFFTMFMSAIVPGYALFQVEKPLGAWSVAGVRVAGYAMMGTAIARQWDHWRDLSRLNSIPDPRYRRYQENLFLFAGGIVVNGLAWAFDVLGAYHIAKREKDFVIYKYGLKENLGSREEEREIAFIRKLVLQESPRERQVREELREALLRYVETYPRGEHRGEVEYYLGSLYAEEGDPDRALLHLSRNLFLFSESRFTPAARRTALSVVQRHRHRWPRDWELLISMFSARREEIAPETPEERILAYLRRFQELRDEEFRRLYVEEAIRVAAENPESEFADDALLGAATQLESLGELEEAVVAYTQLAGVYPQSEHWALSVLRTAELLSALEEPEYARRFYERLLTARPGSPEADVARDALEQ